jgi:hypothetical protein
MNHINEDKLLEHALDLVIDITERDVIETHLAECPDCRASLMRAKNDIGIISSVRPRLPQLSSPNHKKEARLLWPLLRAAALIAFGISVGYGASTWTHKERPCITPSYMTFESSEVAAAGYAVSDATEVFMK